MTTKQHKWHKEIKAWADGAEIECRYPNGCNPNWHKISGCIEWSDKDVIEYRIKPSDDEIYERYIQDLYHFVESSMVFDLPIEKEWNLNNPLNRIDFTVEVLKLWNERIGYKHDQTT